MVTISILLWSLLGIAGLVLLVLAVKWLDRLLLRAEEKGWIFYRKKRPGGFVSSAAGALMNEMDRFIRPSVEHRIQTENPVVKEEEKDGE
jgi:hypothetical protein